MSKYETTQIFAILGFGQDDDDQLSHEEVLDWYARHDVLHLLINNNPAAVSGDLQGAN